MLSQYFFVYLKVFAYHINKFIKDNLVSIYVIDNIFVFWEFNIARVYEYTSDIHQKDMIKLIFKDCLHCDYVFVMK